jgi:phosphoribosylaminoimidazole carboxylase PurE protein
VKIQVIFGSRSDERVYGPLCDALSKFGSVNMAVASAHRNPVQVQEIVKSCGADLFVAGAGLAAHLPGVVASFTDNPVIGVAVDCGFDALDSFLSIVQMPKGVPVAAVHEKAVADISIFLELLSQNKNPFVRVEGFNSNISQGHLGVCLSQEPNSLVKFCQLASSGGLWVGLNNEENFKLIAEKFKGVPV